MMGAYVYKKDGVDLKYSCVSVASSDDSTPQDTPRTLTWGNDSVEKKSKIWNWMSLPRWRSRWTWNLHDGWHRNYQTTKRTTKQTMTYWKRLPWSKKQLAAVLLVLACAVAPMAILGYYTSPSQYSFGVFPFVGIFEDKVLSCGDDMYGTPQNATVTGIEKLFSLDKTFGRFSFSQVKTIDILWDLLIGRGIQLLAWWAAYTVFCDSLLRAIERHPASFSIFQRIALEGPSIFSLWTLAKELWMNNSRRTKALFFYMLWSTAYVLFVPVVLGAMTGYDSTSVAWIDLDGSNNIVPASMLKDSWIITGTKNKTFDQSICKDQTQRSEYYMIESDHRQYCDCQLQNGTIISASARRKAAWIYPYDRSLDDCTYDYAGSRLQYETYDYINEKIQTFQCNKTMDVAVGETMYDASNLTSYNGYCYNQVGYTYSFFIDKARCLPDTADPTYKWGFSTLMSGLFVFFTAAWVVSMYILWQDAQFNSSLVRNGYNMTPLRAAFVMAKTAKKRTGLGEKQLIRANTEGLEKELYGGYGKKRTKVDYGNFSEDPEDGDEDKSVQVISDAELSARRWRGLTEAAASLQRSSMDTK